MAPSAILNEVERGFKTVSKDDSEEKLMSELVESQTMPLWAAMAAYVPPKPQPKAVPFLWRYDKVRPYLIRAGQLIGEDKAERRVYGLLWQQ